MAISRTRAQEYAESVLNRPRGETPVTLRRFRSGCTLFHGRRALTKTHASGVGELQAEFMAQALGLEVPALGGSVSTRIASGALYRAIAISSLDLRRPEARVVLGELLSTAAMQRGAFDTIDV
ncbi:MAG: hypothetical protein IIC31_03040 [Chloroflexi bacterium]|nr:hypothetical protein [Chloroflexota bacterium]